LSVRVARGDFASIEDGVRRLIDERIAERAAEEADDLAWAAPFVETALVQAAEGKLLSLGEHEARIATMLAAMKGG
jgi:hypothetical protein